MAENFAQTPSREQREKFRLSGKTQLERDKESLQKVLGKKNSRILGNGITKKKKVPKRENKLESELKSTSAGKHDLDKTLIDFFQQGSFRNWSDFYRQLYDIKGVAVRNAELRVKKLKDANLLPKTTMGQKVVGRLPKNIGGKFGQKKKNEKIKRLSLKQIELLRNAGKFRALGNSELIKEYANRLGKTDPQSIMELKQIRLVFARANHKKVNILHLRNSAKALRRK